MKIIFDFDDTIFDTQNFKVEFEGIFYSMGVSKELYRETYYSTKVVRGNKVFYKYSLQNQLEAIARINKQINLEQLTGKMDVFLSDLKRFVFEDFYQAITGLNKEDLFLISFGGGDFKKKKIEGGGVAKYFSQIKTGDDKSEMAKELLLDPGEKIFVIDDKPAQLEVIREVLPKANFFRLRRFNSKNTEATPMAFTEISNLSEFRAQIEKINPQKSP